MLVPPLGVTAPVQAVAAVEGMSQVMRCSGSGLAAADVDYTVLSASKVNNIICHNASVFHAAGTWADIGHLHRLRLTLHMLLFYEKEAERTSVPMERAFTL